MPSSRSRSTCRLKKGNRLNHLHLTFTHIIYFIEGCVWGRGVEDPWKGQDSLWSILPKSTYSVLPHEDVLHVHCVPLHECDSCVVILMCSSLFWARSCSWHYRTMPWQTLACYWTISADRFDYSWNYTYMYFWMAGVVDIMSVDCNPHACYLGCQALSKLDPRTT